MALILQLGLCRTLRNEGRDGIPRVRLLMSSVTVKPVSREGERPSQDRQAAVPVVSPGPLRPAAASEPSGQRISIIIATFNRATLLEETLDGLRHQDYLPGDEVIVVDNGSSDGTREVISRAIRTFPVPVLQLREMQSGKSPALNAGVAASSGEILALTDDDVVVAADWVATVRRIFADPSVALVGGRVDPRWERRAPRWLEVEQSERYSPLASPLALLHYGERQELGARTAVGANLIVRRDVLEALGGFAPHLGRRFGTLLCGEDHDLCQRAVAAGYRCEYRPELQVRHWVPAQRTHLTYYLRWFFWSGITNAVLERAPEGPSARAVVPPYLARRPVICPFRAVRYALIGQPASAAAAVMEVSFALGYITQRVRDRFGGASRAPSPGAPLPLPVGNPRRPR